MLLIITEKIINKKVPSILKINLMILIIISSIFAVALMHAAAGVEPHINGYLNRGLGSLSILFPMLISCLLLKSNKNSLVIKLTIILYAGYLSSFVIQRDNYINSKDIQTKIINDLDSKVRSKKIINNKEKDAVVILANIPEFLTNNLNDETIFSDEVTDWQMALNQNSKITYLSTTMTKRKICGDKKRYKISDGHIYFFDPNFETKISDIWFYEFDQKDQNSIIKKIRNENDMNQIIKDHFKC
jgi:hypothetical protein